MSELSEVTERLLPPAVGDSKRRLEDANSTRY